MKKLLFKSILLVSHREKMAKKVEFDPKVNIIKGENDTGKSSLIKSIYYALGAEPHKKHPSWIQADVAILLKFELDSVLYSMYRHRKSFSLFDDKDQIIGTYSSITNELGPVLAKILSFNLKLNNRSGEKITPPPAYLFLPFYIDQDKGWIDTWNSFKNLTQIPKWKAQVVNYHMGLRPDKWYEIDSERKIVESHLEEPRRQSISIKKIITKTQGKLARVDFDIDVDQFKFEIDQLIVECDKLKIQEDKYRQKIVSLRTEKIRVEAQIEIVSKTHDELSADYKYAVNLDGNSVDCPTCGASYVNSFVERFEIAQDAETCDDLLKSLNTDLVKNQLDISEVEASLNANSKEKQSITKLLESKHGKVLLRDLLELEGKKSLLDHLRKELDEIGSILSKGILKVESLTDDMKKYDDKKRKKLILNAYEDSLRKNTTILDVPSLDDSIYRNPSATINL